MDATHDFSDAVPAEQMTPEVRRALARLAEENALLRAANADLRARLEEAELRAERDPLTPLPNRGHFKRALQRVASNAERHGTPAALLHLDIEGLKRINAAYGRLAGDATLIHVARLLSELIRAGDVAARIEEDEFGLILDHLDHNSAIETAERIVRCIEDRPLDLGGRMVPLKVNVGIASILPGDTVDDVLRRAGHNLRRVKQL